MSDLKLTLLILAAVLILTFTILTVYWKQKQEKEAGLVHYCQAHDLYYHKEKGNSLTEVIIEGEGFSLASEKRSVHNPSLDEYHWEMRSNWSSSAKGGPFAAFVLGSLPADSDWAGQTDFVKALAVQRIVADTGLDLDPDQAQVLLLENKKSYLLFEETAGCAQIPLARLKPLLSSLADKITVYIKSGPDGASIMLDGHFVDSADSLQQILELGQELARD